MAAYSELSVTAAEVKPRGSRVSFVAVRIPDLQRFREICEQRATTAGHPQLRPFAVFAFEAFLDLAVRQNATIKTPEDPSALRLSRTAGVAGRTTGTA